LPSYDDKWDIIKKYFKNSNNGEDEHLGHNSFEFTENKYKKERKKKLKFPIIIIKNLN